MTPQILLSLVESALESRRDIPETGKNVFREIWRRLDTSSLAGEITSREIRDRMERLHFIVDSAVRRAIDGLVGNPAMREQELAQNIMTEIRYRAEIFPLVPTVARIKNELNRFFNTAIEQEEGPEAGARERFTLETAKRFAELFLQNGTKPAFDNTMAAQITLGVLREFPWSSNSENFPQLAANIVKKISEEMRFLGRISAGYLPDVNCIRCNGPVEEDSPDGLCAKCHWRSPPSVDWAPPAGVDRGITRPELAERAILRPDVVTREFNPQSVSNVSPGNPDDVMREISPSDTVTREIRTSVSPAAQTPAVEPLSRDLHRSSDREAQRRATQLEGLMRTILPTQSFDIGRFAEVFNGMTPAEFLRRIGVERQNSQGEVSPPSPENDEEPERNQP